MTNPTVLRTEHQYTAQPHVHAKKDDGTDRRFSPRASAME